LRMEEGERGDGAIIFIQSDDGTLPCKEEDTESFLQYRRQFEMDQYYDKLSKYTFKTRFVQLEVEETKAWREYNRGGKLDSIQEANLNSLKQKLENEISFFVKSGSNAFVRLSTRSPKDAADKIPSKLIPLFVNQLKIQMETSKSEGKELDNNDKLIALRKAFFQVMSVKSAEEVMNLMMFSSRAVSDIKRALDYIDKTPWNLKLIVREFVDIPIEGEFRGFVHERSLNCVSQYYSDCYFPTVHHNKENIKNSILNYFQLVKDLIEPPSYIIDFVVMKDHLMIVELNPYGKGTGGCLFDWQKDLHVIENGPFELRVNEKPIKHVEQMLFPWKSLLDSAYEQLQQEAIKSNNPCRIS